MKYCVVMPFILWHMKVNLSVSLFVSVFLISAVSSQCSVYLFFENNTLHTHHACLTVTHSFILSLNKTILQSFSALPLSQSSWVTHRGMEEFVLLKWMLSL